jgi:RNA polymerase sigma-70 factor (ECF subfamily)
VEPVSLEGLFQRYSSGVFRRASSILGDRDAAKDVMQEVFLRAVRARAELGAAPSPIAWLYRVTTNLCLNRLRDLSRHKRLLLSTGPSPVVPLGTPHPLDSALTAHALLRLVPEELQEIAIYYFIDNLSQDEISSLVGVSRRTIGYRLDEFRARMRELDPHRELAS